MLTYKSLQICAKSLNFDLLDLENGPFERLNIIQLLPVYSHLPIEGSWKNREKVTEQFLRNLQICAKSLNFDLLDLENGPFERFNRIQLSPDDPDFPGETS